MNEVIKYIIKSHKPLVRKEDLKDIMAMSLSDWQKKTEKVKGKCRFKKCDIFLLTGRLGDVGK